MNLNDIVTMVTALVAVYGAILSSVIAIKNIKGRKRQLKLRIIHDTLSFRGEQNIRGIFVILTNPGNRNVTVRTPSIHLADKSFLCNLEHIRIPPRFPLELPEGESTTAYIEEETVREKLVELEQTGKVKLKARVEDGTLKEYWSDNYIEFDVTEEEANYD